MNNNNFVEEYIMRKSSYMNTKNILNESFFTKIIRAFGLAKNSKPKNKSKDQLKKDLNGFNDSMANLEKSFESLYGKKFNFSRLTMDDVE